MVYFDVAFIHTKNLSQSDLGFGQRQAHRRTMNTFLDVNKTRKEWERCVCVCVNIPAGMCA